MTVIDYPIYQNITFWIAVGLFVYFTGNFFYLIFSSSNSDENIRTQMKIIYGVVTIAKNLILSFAMFGQSFEINNVSKSDDLKLPNEIDLDDFINFKNDQ